MSESKKSTGSKMVKSFERALFILVILASTAFWVTVLYSDYNKIEGSDRVLVADAPGITEVDLRINMDIGQTNVKISDLVNKSELVSVSWTQISTTLFFQEEPNPLNVTVNKTIIGNRLIVLVESKSESMFTHMSGWNYIETEIAIHPAYLVNITAISETGSLNVVTNNATLSRIDVNGDTGSVALALTDTVIEGNINIVTSTGSSFVELFNTRVDGDINIGLNTGAVDISMVDSTIGADISLSTDTGSIFLDVMNLTINSDCMVTMQSSTGSQQIEWMQPHALGGNLTLDLSSDTGSIEVNYLTILSESRYHVDLSADTGSIDLSSSMDFNVQEYDNREVYTSINYGNLNLPFIDITASADTGSVDVAIYDS